MEKKQQNEKKVLEQPCIRKGANYAIVEFEQKLILDINQSGLPVSIVRLILRNILKNVEETENNVVKQEQNAFITECKKNQVKKEGGEN